MGHDSLKLAAKNVSIPLRIAKGHPSFRPKLWVLSPGVEELPVWLAVARCTD